MRVGRRFKAQLMAMSCAMVGIVCASGCTKGPVATSVSAPSQPATLETPPVGPSWPQWLGPHRDGISDEKGWSDHWPAEGLKVRWTREVGIGFSSIAISGHALYTMGHVDGNEVVSCLDVDTGEERWNFTYAAELMDNLHEGGPGATPTVEGESVYTLGKEGQLYCLRADSGEIVWRRNVQADLQVPLPEWGFASSPLIVGDQLFLEVGCVVSYHKQTGKLNWKTEPHEAGYGSPALLPYGGKSYLATLDCNGLRVVDTQDGKEFAFAPWESRFDTNSTTPIVWQDKVFISTAYDVGCGLFRVTSNGLDMIYQNREMRNHFNNSILYEGHLYGFDGNSNLGRVVQLKCMELETGKVCWSQRGLGCGSLLVANGKLVILSEQGALVLAEASPAGYQELARSPFLTGRCWTVPTLLGGRIYGRNAAGKLVCAQLPLD